MSLVHTDRLFIYIYIYIYIYILCIDLFIYVFSYLLYTYPPWCQALLVGVGCSVAEPAEDRKAGRAA